MAATQAAASTHLVYSQAAESMGHQGYTHFHQCRIKRTPKTLPKEPWWCHCRRQNTPVPNDKPLPVESPNAACPQQSPGGQGCDGACILQGVWVKHCTLCPAVASAATAPARRCPRPSGQRHPFVTWQWAASSSPAQSSSLQLSSAKHSAVAYLQHPGKSQAGPPGCKAGAAA